MGNWSYFDCRMRCSAAVLLYLLLSGHVLPQAVHSQLTKALQLSRFLMLLLRANVFDLCFVQCGVLALFHHYELNPLQTPSKPESLDTAELLQPNYIVHQERSLTLCWSFLFSSMGRSGKVESS